MDDRIAYLLGYQLVIAFAAYSVACYAPFRPLKTTVNPRQRSAVFAIGWLGGTALLAAWRMLALSFSIAMPDVVVLLVLLVSTYFIMRKMISRYERKPGAVTDAASNGPSGT